MIHALKGRMFYVSLRGSAESLRGEYSCSDLSSKRENIMNLWGRRLRENYMLYLGRRLQGL